jgi:hypothetical protein
MNAEDDRSPQDSWTGSKLERGVVVAVIRRYASWGTSPTTVSQPPSSRPYLLQLWSALVLISYR